MSYVKSLYSGALSFTVHPLAGDRLLRMIFMDEGGTSQKEPVAVVASVILNADGQFRALEDHLEEVKRKHIPQEHQADFVFHAKGIWSGKLPVFKNRDEWPLVRRAEILKDLLSARGIIGFSVSVGFVYLDPYVVGDMKEYALFRHVTAYMESVFGCEAFMREHGEPGEFAMLVAEDHPTNKKDLEWLHRELVHPNSEVPIHRDLLPMRHIYQQVLFAKKQDSRMLQYADACAFCIRRFLSGKDDIREVLDSLIGPMKHWPKRRPAGPAGVIRMSSLSPEGQVRMGPFYKSFPLN